MQRIIDFFRQGYDLPFLILYAFLLHLVLFLYSNSYPVFLDADRADDRLYKIENFNSLPGIAEKIEYLSAHGIIGDYYFQALVYELFNENGLVLFQIFLALFSYYALYKMAFLIFKRRIYSFFVVFLYMHFAHSLVFPHQLITEAFFNPLIIISFYYLFRLLFEKNKIYYGVLASGLIGLANLIRPVTVLFPLVVLAIVFVYKPKFQTKPLFAYTILNFIPLFLWMSFIFFQTGEFGMGRSGHDLGSNLYKRVAAISRVSDEMQQEKIKAIYLADAEEGRLKVLEYFDFAIHHPLAFIKHYVRDTFTFFFKTGINRLLVDFLKITPQSTENPTKSWRKVFDKEGAWYTLTFFAKEYPILIAFNIVSSLLFLPLILLSVGGSIKILLDKGVSPIIKLSISLLLLLLAYLFLISQVVEAIQSRHRSPAEFAIVFLFVLSLWYIRGSINKNRASFQELYSIKLKAAYLS